MEFNTVIACSMIQNLFVYGTLAPGKPNEHVLENIGGSWQSASVRGKLYDEGWGAALGYPGIVMGEAGEEISGFLFSSDKLAEHWESLDDFEGEGYERILTMAKLTDESSVEAFVYVLKRN